MHMTVDFTALLNSIPYLPSITITFVTMVVIWGFATAILLYVLKKD
jgi:hypothetical protein